MVRVRLDNDEMKPITVLERELLYCNTLQVGSKADGETLEIRWVGLSTLKPEQMRVGYGRE